MKLSSHILSVAVLAVTLFHAAPAFACKCVERVDPKDMEIGFWGTVESIEPKGSRDKVSFNVDQQFRGEERAKVNVFASRFEHDCGIRFEVGKTYVVYAYSFYPRGVATSQCWYSYQRDEAPTDEEFSRPKKDIREPTELEKKLRPIAKLKVPVCGRGTRVRNSGFSIIVAPDGDPVQAPTGGPVAQRDLDFQTCVTEALLDEIPRPEEPVRIEGWYQSGDKDLPVLLDEIPCGEDCPDWPSQIRSALFDVELPLDEETAKARAAAFSIERTREAQLKMAEALCPFEGVDAGKNYAEAGDAPPAPPGKKAEILLNCALTRGEFLLATDYKNGAPNPVLSAALDWARAKAKEGQLYPIRTEGPTFAEYWFENNPEEQLDNFRVLRSAFLGEVRWANQPAFLEAFAETILADKDAPDGMRDYAALAYEKAARLRPEATVAYKNLAAQVSTSPKFAELQKQLDEAFAKAQEARNAEIAARQVAPLPEEETGEGVEEAEGGGGNPYGSLVYLIGAFVLVVVAAGAYQRFKK